jgi:hypothetical protein
MNPDQPQRIPNTFTLFVRGHRAQKIETHKLSPTAPERDRGEAANTQKS